MADQDTDRPADEQPAADNREAESGAKPQGDGDPGEKGAEDKPE